MTRSIAGLVLVAVLGHAPDQKGQAARWLGVFTALPGAHRLCGQHVVGKSGSAPAEIAFTLYATTREARETVRFYSQAHNVPMKSGSQTITVKAGDNKVLAVHPASGQYPECGVKPAPDDRAVIVVSERVR